MSSRGFSLVEMVTVLSIISIVTLISTPPLMRWKAHAEVRGAAAQISAGIQLARNYALIHQDNVVIKFNSRNYQVFVDNGDGGASRGDWLQSGSERILCSYDQPAGLSVSSTFPSDRFRFKGFGRNQPGTITLEKNGVEQVDIIINVLGRVRSKYK